MKPGTVMPINLEDLLPADIVASYQASALAQGVSLEDLVRDRLIEKAPHGKETAMLSGDDWERAFDQFFDSFPSTGPLPDEAFDREHIYEREDSW